MSVEILVGGKIKVLLAIVSLASVVTLGACSGSSSTRASSSRQLVPSSHELVLPSSEMRTVQLLSGFPEPGSDLGPFLGRRDGRLGALSGHPERIDYGFERRIYDRQYSTTGRPYNTYIDTTRTITRVGQ